jgi:hypothetical protein
VLSKNVIKKLLIASHMHGFRKGCKYCSKTHKKLFTSVAFGIHPCGYQHLLDASFGHPFVTPLAAFTKPAEIEIIKDQFTKK